MHMVIRAIVFARTKTDALSEARRVFERLAENGDPFDFYTMFDEDGTVGSGKDRWGNLPAAVKATTKAGKKLIEEGWEHNRNEFFEALKAVRENVATYTDEQLFQDKDVVTNGMRGMFRHYCWKLGQYEGTENWLYDNDGSAIRDSQHLESALNKWQSLYERDGKENPDKDLLVWVVPADVHC